MEAIDVYPPDSIACHINYMGAFQSAGGFTIQRIQNIAL
jgi:hypothetical protein